VIDASDVLVSVGPPEHAVTMAESIVRAGSNADHRPMVVDVNAVSPATMSHVAGVLKEARFEFVDGAISGMPPRLGSVTTLYLAGRQADRVADLAAGPELRRLVVGEQVGRASAVKMCTASMYKGFAGLLMQALSTARENDVVSFVLDDISRAFGDHLTSAATQIALAASKSDRYPGEMRQIAQTQGAVGARPELFEAFALVFEQASRSLLGTLTPEQAGEQHDLAAVLLGLATPSSRTT
jgi:3-hydroxyisobutyrate dehydrogenase-like beta-hydroxyacid dehydrogenase